LAIAPPIFGLKDRCVRVAERVQDQLVFAGQRRNISPARLDLTDLDAPTIAAFLDHLQHQRGKQRLTCHTIAAQRSCPSLTGKKITPHILRHTAAMRFPRRSRHHRHRAMARLRHEAQRCIARAAGRDERRYLWI
jgi:hypothetical protein